MNDRPAYTTTSPSKEMGPQQKPNQDPTSKGLRTAADNIKRHEDDFSDIIRTIQKSSKRSIKNNSGRTSRRQMNGQKLLQSVGGFARDVDAIYASATISVENPNFKGLLETPNEPEFIEVPRKMCHVVEDREGHKKKVTMNVGGSTLIYYLGGKGGQ